MCGWQLFVIINVYLFHIHIISLQYHHDPSETPTPILSGIYRQSLSDWRRLWHPSLCWPVLVFSPTQPYIYSILSINPLRSIQLKRYRQSELI